MSRLLAGLDDAVAHLEAKGFAVRRDASGFMISATVGGKYHRVDVIWDRAPGVIEIFVVLPRHKVARERRAAVAVALQAINAKLSAPGFYLGEEVPMFRISVRRNHDDSVSTHVLDKALNAALWSVDRCGAEVEAAARG